MIPETISALFPWMFNFAIAFTASFLGSISDDILRPIENQKETRLSNRAILIKGICFSFFTALIMSAVIDVYVNISYPIYLAISGLIGAFNDFIFVKFINAKFMTVFIKNLLKAIPNIFTKAAADSINEISKEENRKDDSCDKKVEDANINDSK